MRYRLVIFDFDGTLADTFPWILSVMDHLADRFGYERVDPAEIETLRGSDPRTLIQKYNVPLWKIPSMAGYVRGLMAKDVHRLGLFPGIGDLLNELARQGAVLAVVTTNSCENVTRVLGPDTAALISHFECGVDLFGKQDKIRRVLRKSGISAREAIAIGDEMRDIEAAKQAGVTSGAVAWGYATVSALEARGPDVLFGSVREIGEHII
jgi:phosphoglycolate phosphatase